MGERLPLVCRFGALGDMVMMTPMLKRLHERSGQAADLIAIGEWNHLLFENSPYVRHVYTITSRKSPVILNRSKRDLVKRMKASGEHFAWICESNRHSLELMRRCGYDMNNSIRAMDHAHGIDEHFVDYWLRLSELTPEGCHYPAEASSIVANVELTVTDYEIDVCKNWLNTRGISVHEPIICIQAGNKRTMRGGKRNRTSNHKYWPEQNWASLIDRIRETIPEAQFLLCGVPPERLMTIEIKSLCKDQSRVYSVADDLPLRRLMAVLSMAHSCVSVDTGPAHIAAAMDCPVTVLLGKADPRIYRPRSTTSEVVLIAGRDESIELGPGDKNWAAAHDISLIDVDRVVDGWRSSFEQND